MAAAGPLRTTLTLALVLSTSACAAISGRPAAPAGAAETDAAISAMGGAAAVTAYQAETDPTRRTERRNEILTARIYGLDVAFHRFEGELARDAGGASLAGDLAHLGLTAAATASSGAGARADLSAAANWLTGARDSGARAFGGSQTLPVLLATMEAQRKAVLARLTRGMARSAADYPLTRGLIDVEAYDQAGTIGGALGQALVDAGAKANAADGEIAASFSASFSADDAQRRLRAFWKDANGVVRPDADAALKAWMAAHGVATGDITSFLYADSLAAQRAQAVHDLSL